MPFTIRHLKSKSDLVAYMDLCVYCFSMSAEYTRFYASFVGEYLDHTFAAFDEKRLVAAMWYIPFEMNTGGGYLPMGGVAAVATYPEARNLGLAKTLMAHAHRQMRDEGRPLASLQPFKPEFYARMGYGDVFYYQGYSVKPGSIARRDLKGFKLVSVDGVAEWKTIDRLHREYGENYIGSVKRSRSYWIKRYLTSGMGARYHYLIVNGGEPRGFIITHVDKPLPAYSPDASRPSQLSIVQAVWNDQGSFDAIMQFIRSHADQYDKVHWRLPTDVSIHDRLVDPRIDVAIRPKMMLKLVDLKGAIEGRRWPSDLNGEINLQVKGDDTSPWNDGLWRVRWSGGEAHVVKARTSPRSGVIRTDIQTLTVLYSGHRSAARLRDLGTLAGPPAPIELLERAFPQQVCYIDEWF